MATDVIIDPANGQIYWNDGTGSPQSIAIGGNALDTISVSGYSAAYSPGSTPAASAAGVLVNFKDLATGTLTPGTNAYELGSGTLRWKFFGTTTNISDNGSALGTNTFSLTTGLLQINGGIAISGNAGVAQTLFLFNPNDPRYFVGLRSSASLASTQIYTFPLTYPSTGSSILQSDTAGTLTWVPMTAASSSASTALNINIVSATTGTFFPLFTNTSTTANGISGVAVSVDSNFSFDAASNVLIVDGATMGGLGLTTTLASFDIGNTSAIAQTLNFSNTTTGQVQFNFGTASASASTATFFGSQNSNRMILNVNSSGNVYLQTNQVNARVRLFQNNTTGNVSIFGTGGGTLYLGEDSTTNNADIALRGTVLNGGGGNVRAAVFSISTATSNGSGVGGTIQFQTSTSGNATANLPNALRTRLRIEGAATGTSSLESIIILGDATSGTAWSSYLRGVDASGTDVEAGEIQIQAGRSTGTGAARGISFYVSPSGTTSSTINAASQIARFSSTGFTIYSTTSTFSTITGALIVAGGVGIGGTIFTAPGNASSISGVILSNGVVTSGSWNGTAIAPLYGGTGQNYSASSGILKYTTGTASLVTAPSGAIVGTTDSQNLTNKTYNNVTVTAPATNATITIADTTTFATSGAFNLTLTTTALTNVTLPSGTKTLVATDVTSLASLTTASSLNSIGTIGTGVWNGTAIAPQYGGTGQNYSASSGILKYTTGTASLVTAPSGAIVGTTDSQNLTNKTYNNVTVTAPATNATITIADTTTFTTSGANNLTLTTTATTNATFPSGTKTLVATDVTSLASLTTASSLNSIGTISTGVWAATAITSHYGGTGLQSPFVVGDILYATTATTWGRLASSATSGQVLTSTGAASLPTWQNVPPAAASSVAVAPTVVNGSFSITAVNSASGSGLGLSTIASFVVNPSTGLVSLSGLAVTSLTASGTTSSGALVVTGGVGIGASVNIGKSLNLWNPAYTFSTNLASGAATSTITYILPPGPPNGLGTSVLSSSNTGTLSWIAQSSGGSGSPGGTDTAIQFNDASAFGGTSGGFSFTKATHTVSIGSTNQTNLTSIGLQLYNNNASSFSGTVKWSPAIEFMGRSFTTTGSIDNRVRFLNEVQAFTNTYNQKLVWKFSYDTGTASYTNPIMILNSQTGVGIGASDQTAVSYFRAGNQSSVDLSYTLPIAYPTGTGTSYLSASTTGVMAWVAAPSGGGGTPGGSTKQIQYNNASSFAGASGFEYVTGGIANTVSHFVASGTGYTGGLWIHSINGSTTRVGIGLSNPQYELEILGEISATNKSFVIDHPIKPNMKLRYGSLEGPENGVYVRGILISDNVIETPDYWVGLVDPDTFTVNLTPIGKFAQLYVEKIEDYKVYVGNSSATNIHCFYTIWAERKDIPKLVTEY